jgi:exopolysaccharide biosynthesis protein
MVDSLNATDLTRWINNKCESKSTPSDEGAAVFTYCDPAFRVIITRVDPAKAKFRGLVNIGNVSFGNICKIDKNSVFINAHFFDENRRILGLLISEGVLASPLSSLPDFSGVFLVMKSGQAMIVHRNAYGGLPEDQIAFAVQGHPLIIEPGRKEGIYSDDQQEFKRTVLGIDRENRVYLLSFDANISLFQVQKYLMDKFPQIDAAMNLDGGPSVGNCRNGQVIISPAYVIPSIIQVAPNP